MTALFAALALCLLLPCQATAQQPVQLDKARNSPKLVRPDAALEPFARGAPTAAFIVTLQEPDPGQGQPSLLTDADKKRRAAQVQAALDAFLAGDPAGPGMRVTRRFTYMPAFAASCTPEALARLLDNARVRVVEPDGELTPRLLQGAP